REHTQSLQGVFDHLRHVARFEFRRSAKTLDAVCNLLDPVMDALTGPPDHAKRFITNLLARLLLHRIPCRQVSERVLDLFFQKPCSGYHRLEQIFEVMTDIAEEIDHFSFLRVLEMLSLHDCESSERRNNGQKRQIILV